jgi:hypothetical protein
LPFSAPGRRFPCASRLNGGSTMRQDVEALREIRDAVDDLGRRLTAPPVPERSDVWCPKRYRALTLALRFCVSHAEGMSLAQALRQVPDEYVEDIAGDLAVRCVCGTLTPLVDEMTDCYGSCGRWFVGDRSGVWAVRLPASDVAS